MNPVEEMVRNFQDLVALVHESIQPFIVMLAGAIPLIEGEISAMIGVVGGLNPIIAGIAGATGNFLAVLIVVLVTSRARSAVVNHNATRVQAMAAAPVSVGAPGTLNVPELQDPVPVKPESKRRQRVNRWLVRFGVPGASILGPLAIPTHFTAAIFVAAGTPRRWVLLWQAIAIALWTTVGTISVWAALTFLVGV